MAGTYNQDEAYGFLANCGVEKETTYGIDPATSTQWLALVKEFTPAKMSEYVERRGYRNNRARSGATHTRTWWEGNIGGDLDIALPLAIALGSCDITGSVKTITPINTVAGRATGVFLPSFCLRTDFISTVEKPINLLGCVAESIDVRCVLGEAITFTLPYFAQSKSASAIGAISEPTGTPHHGEWDATVNVSEDAAVYAAAGDIDIGDILQEIGFTATNNLQKAGVWNDANHQMRQPTLGEFALDVSFKFHAGSDDIETYLMDNAVNSFNITLTNATQIIDIDLNGCYNTDGRLTTTRDKARGDYDLTLQATDIIVTATDSEAYFDNVT